MSVLTCQKCGKLTNTGTARWFTEGMETLAPDGEAFECYAAWENEKWVKGCAYDTATPMERGYASRVLKAKD